ncbi:aldehyde ferredoxin oxidoreductase N-terminal domain-containing protein [Chloroflexota bacterium]
MAKHYGYAGEILRVDLSLGKITRMSTMCYTEKFLGGRGIAAKIYWDEVSSETKAFDPENHLIFATGPLAGFKGVTGSRWQICGKSPLTTTERFSYTNLGGGWGAQLKFAGYDALVVHGKSDKPVYIIIQDEKIEIRDASALWGKTTIETREILKQEMGNALNVVAIGPAGENMVNFASLLADKDAHGSGGFGAVMGSKRLKAIAVRGSREITMADPGRYQDLASYARKLASDIPLKDTPRMDPSVKLKRDPCWGCMGGCIRKTYRASDGRVGKFGCAAAVFYALRAQRYYGEWNEVPFLANRLCNEYGLDMFPIDTMMMWLSRCHKAGILTDENTGIPISKQGSLEFVDTLVKKIAFREGFGDILAQGTVRAAELVGQGAKEQITDYMIDTGHNTIQSPRMYILTGFLYAMEPRQPMQQLSELYKPFPDWFKWVGKEEGSYLSNDVLRAIAKRIWGSELAVDFCTYEGKALAAKMIQDRQYAKESLILCDYLFPITHDRSSEDHVGDPTIESKLLSAVVGNEVDEEGLNRIGERIFNLQRAILVREGHRGRESDRLAEYNFTQPLKFELYNPEFWSPGNGDQVVRREGAVIDRERFEEAKSEYYELRGWDVDTGLQTKSKLAELGLEDISRVLEKGEFVI